MIDTPAAFAPAETSSVPLHLVTSEGLTSWLETQPERVRSWVASMGFKAGAGAVLCVPDGAGALSLAVCGLGNARDRMRGRMTLGAARVRLPMGAYHLETDLDGDALDEQLLGWLMAGYRFERFRQGAPAEFPALKAPEGCDAERLQAIASAEFLVRDLINMPAAHMGPEELETAMLALADEFGAHVSVTYGDDLLHQNFPMIHAVGRASDRIPRLLDMRWGETGPQVTLVGKGVCFDTGGLDIKPASSMALMKKDMGGAAHVLGLAMMIMATGWKVRLRVLIPAVENAISGCAFRPGDILTARNGLTVEINNTDAEGRLVLADALALAAEDKPDALICMATLTGAARVAVGPDLAPFYTDDENLAQALASAGRSQADPVWRMPFHEPYEALIEPGIADLDNAPSGGMAGSITAALFLRRFVPDVPRFAHFDIYAWSQKDAPGRTKGGTGQAIRALFAALPGVLDLR